MDKRISMRLLLGDVLDRIKEIEDESVDLIVTDPPYNLNKNYGNTKDNLFHNDYIEFTRKWVKEAHRVLKKDGTIYIFMGMRYISYLYIILEEELGMKFNSWITWYYTQGIGKKKGFSPRHDDILMFNKSDKFKFNLDDVRVPQKYYRSINNMRGANPGNVWEFSHIHYCNGNRKKHPTQKPEALFERMILASSDKGDTVLDCFLGSGTSARVCQQLDRNFIGIELNEEYMNIAKERLKEEFAGFDSTDEKMLRVPNDLNNKEIREEYIKNHIDWFLSNHESDRKKFLDNVHEKYGKENEFYNQLTFENF
ncbi:DNA-methyltransferase [Peptoniphilus asaccharolyticus]